MTSSEIGSLLNVANPGTFLSTYSYLLRDQKQNSRRALVSTTKRLLGLYLKAEGELSALTLKADNSVMAWFRNRRKIKAAKQRIEKLKNEIFSWVDKTITFFVSGDDKYCFRA